MRSAVLLALLLVGGLGLSGCLGAESSSSSSIPEPRDGLPKFVPELPPVYVSTEEILYQDYADPAFPRVVEVLLGSRGAEPNIGVTSEGGIFITAYDSTMRSMDGGKTWEEVYDFQLAPNAPADPLSTSDPMLWVDPVTDRIFTNHMFPALACSSNIISDDNGETWTHFPMSCGLGAPYDHQKIMTAKSRQPAPMPAYENVVYECYNKLLSTNCAVSYDGGIHYQYETIAADNDNCGGINGHPAAAPDGTVYVPLGLNCGVPHVAVTEDNGLTWSVKSFGEAVKADHGENQGNKPTPSWQTLDVDPEITVTPDGTAYYYTRGGDQTGYMFRSKDKFATVDGPFKVSPPDVKSVVFAAMMSGADGNVAIAYLGTRDYDGYPSAGTPNATWHLFLSTSFDAAGATPTFLTQQVTPPADPVQIGCVWLEGGGNACRNLLDFIDGVVDKDGRVHIAFTDGCTARLSCANNPKATNAESRDRSIALAIQDHGPSLLDENKLLDSLGWTTQVTDLSS